RAPEREAEDADRADAARRQEIEGAPEIPALLEAERRQAPLAPAEVALVEEEDGEAGGQPGRDRQHVGTVGRIAVQEDDGRRARPRASAGRAATASGDAFLAWPRVQAALQDLERIRRA